MFTPTSEILNKNLEKKAIIPDKRALLASAEPVEDLYNLKLPQVDESNPAVVLDYNNETENVKVGYMSELLKDTELVDIASDFYFYKDNVKFDTAEDVIKYWMSDRTWKQTNTVSMSKELMFVTEDDQNLKQLANLKYLSPVPHMWLITFNFDMSSTDG